MKIITADNVSEYAFLKNLSRRANETSTEIIKSVKEIIQNVRENGDKAVLFYSEKFDNATSIQKFTKKDFEAAYNKADTEFKNAVSEAAKRIAAFHEKQIRDGYEIRRNGCVIGQLVRGLDKVGLYVPGGTAAYPSSVLMNTIPAKLANVNKIIMITPPSKNGTVNEDILVAAYIAGVDEMYTVGGAHGIAAISYGTESIEKVDKIVGPGNIYVATAKRLVYGEVDIDMVAGPSEIMIMADKYANPEYIAADLLSQAEHDPLASAILVTNNKNVADKVIVEIDKQIAALNRADIIQKSLNNFGGVIICDTIDKMVELVNITAPEHLEILINNPENYLDKIKNAGSVFLGEYSPEPLGDYLAGTNHVLPTSGTARFYSPLSVDSFIKKIQYINYTADELKKVGQDIITIAEREGLSAHAMSIKMRLK